MAPAALLQFQERKLSIEFNYWICPERIQGIGDCIGDYSRWLLKVNP